MDLKKKITTAKNKIKENRSAILAVVSTGVAIGVSVVHLIAMSEYNKELAVMVDDLESLNDKLDKVNNTEMLYLSHESIEKVRNGDPDIWFAVDGDRFDVVMHPKNED